MGGGGAQTRRLGSGQRVSANFVEIRWPIPKMGQKERRDPMTEQHKSEEQKIAVLKEIADTLKNIRSELREIRVAVIGLRRLMPGSVTE
jgi:hypothetical protein